MASQEPSEAVVEDASEQTGMSADGATGTITESGAPIDDATETHLNTDLIGEGICDLIAKAVLRKRPAAAAAKGQKMTVASVAAAIADPQAKSQTMIDISDMRARRQQINEAKKQQSLAIKKEERKARALRQKTQNWSNNDLMSVFLLRKHDEDAKRQRLATAQGASESSQPSDE